MKIQFNDLFAELKSFSMTGTYNSCLEGSRQKCSARIFEKERKTAANGRILVDPIWKDGRQGNELPSFRCITSFREFIDGDFYDLDVVFFAEEPLENESMCEYISRFTKEICYKSSSVRFDLGDL